MNLKALVIPFCGLILSLGCSGDKISQEEKESLEKEMALDAIEVEKNKEKAPDLQIDIKNLCNLAENFPWSGRAKELSTTFIDKTRSTLSTKKISQRFEDILKLDKEERNSEFTKLLIEHGIPKAPCDRLKAFLAEDYGNL